MIEVFQHIVLPYSCHDLYGLVNAVKEYPEFIPGCERVEVHFENETRMQATIHLRALGISGYVTTENTMDPPHHIEIKWEEDGYQYILANWHFHQGVSACSIQFNARLQWSRPWLNWIPQSLVQASTAPVARAFIHRAHQRLRRYDGTLLR